jgi:UDP-glucuronate 4-epimerase
MHKKILVTGSAGFIGSALSLKLLEFGAEVVGIDNHNDYYDVQLKEDRLARHLNNKKYTHVRMDIEDADSVQKIFKDNEFDAVIHLAAQAGVRYSIENPLAYVNTNIVGFVNIIEACRHNKIKHLIYASSSSVYGANTKMPFSVHDNVDHPQSLYAASKKTNELIAHTYSHLYNIPTTGLRFFTVYGPWGRPDMALHKFTSSIVKGEKIKVFNFGKHKRDFTYIDDIIEGILKVLSKSPSPNINWDGESPDPSSSNAPWRVYNIGNNKPEELLDYIRAIEIALKMKAKKELLPLQPGDVPNTYADVKDLVNDFNYEPKTNISEGRIKFC